MKTAADIKASPAHKLILDEAPDGMALCVRTPHAKLNVIASWGAGWDHVSVSTPERTPSWDEMDFVKRLFFCDDETAVQIHPPVARHINLHPHCLHLWRRQGSEIELPPEIFV